MRNSLIGLLMLVAQLGWAQPPNPVAAIPGPGETVRVAPKSVRIRFDNEVNLKESSFKVYRLELSPAELMSPKTLDLLSSEVAERVQEGSKYKAMRVDEGLVARLRTTSSEIELKLRPLLPGSYMVVWHVDGLDGEGTEGFFVFVYQP